MIFLLDHQNVHLSRFQQKIPEWSEITECDNLLHWSDILLWTEQRFPWGSDVNRDFSRASSQVIRSYWAHLWCSPSAGCNQSSGSLYKSAAVLLFRWLCVFRESTPSDGSVFSVWGETLECLRFLSIHFFPPWSVTFASPFMGQMFFLFIYHFDRISGWLWVLFPPPPLRHPGTSLLWPFCDLCSALLVSQPATPCPSTWQDSMKLRLV